MPSAKGVAHDIDGGVASCQSHEARALEGIEHASPLHAGTHAGGAALDIDGELVECPRSNQDAVMKVAAVRPVSTRLHRDAQPGVARRGKHELQVGQVSGSGDSCWALHKCEVPRASGIAPGVVGRQHQSAVHCSGKFAQQCARWVRHWSSRSVKGGDRQASAAASVKTVAVRERSQQGQRRLARRRVRPWFVWLFVLLPVRVTTRAAR